MENKRWALKKDVEETIDPKTREEFEKLAKQWRHETGHLSSVSSMVKHPAYQSIIAMGEKSLPLILERMYKNPNHYFWALTCITGDDPSVFGEPTQKAYERWLEWGQEHGYLECTFSENEEIS